MDDLNINNLPAEILTEVFGYLNVENLKNATIVCQLWNNLIESTFRWSLELVEGWNATRVSMKKNFAVTTNRKFGKIEMWGGHLNKDDQIVKTFKRHGLNVVELKLRLCRIDDLAGFAELLNFTPNLKHLAVLIEILDGSNDELLTDQLLPDLKKLESLAFSGIGYGIIKCFRKAKLTTIEIIENKGMESLLVDFLSTQDKLTRLYTCSTSILFELGKLNVRIPFRLTQLSISNINCQKPSQNYENLQRFIESQAGNLTEIQMRHGISASVYECVFTNMTKLTTLWVMTKDLPKNNDFYDQLKENGNVHTVRLLDDDYRFDYQFVGKFLQKFPNIRCLVSRSTNLSLAQNILVIAQSSSKLDSLSIEEIDRTSVGCVQFPNLKTLHIRHLRGRINWNEFTKAHPLLTELTIVRMDKKSYLTTGHIDRMTTNLDLQHIRLGAGFVADNRFFEIVASKCTNLKVLDLHKSCISQNLEHYLRIDVLRLRDWIECQDVFCSEFLWCSIKL